MSRKREGRGAGADSVRADLGRGGARSDAGAASVRTDAGQGGARDRILRGVAAALSARPTEDHPGDFGAWRPDSTLDGIDTGQRVARFESLFVAAGGEVVHVHDLPLAKAWMTDFATSFDSVAVGLGVPSELGPELTSADAAQAALGVSRARGAIAETGSLMMDARDGRRTQLLVPTHVVIVERSEFHATLRDALAAMRDELPSAIGLHSGPSKSADIGQIMVKGVHGPGRVVALVIGDETE